MFQIIADRLESEIYRLFSCVKTISSLYHKMHVLGNDRIIIQ